jgi:hypothetical protein
MAAPTGSLNHVAAVALNVTWQRVKRLFARKGIVL